MGKKRILIFGVNGFIGSNLLENILENGDYFVDGIDLLDNNINRFKNNYQFNFIKANIFDLYKEMESSISSCDIIIPLIANPKPYNYIKDPIGIFDLTFRINERILFFSAKYKKRLIFPSSSEVYGFCHDEFFSEDTSNLTYGPIKNARWIYACSKQLLERLILGYSQMGLRFCIFRPFNWIGPNQDNNTKDNERKRLIPAFIDNLKMGLPLAFVEGGGQRRCFTDITDATECLMKIINTPDKADGNIFNIGNPDNEYTIKEVGTLMIKIFNQRNQYLIKPVNVSGEEYYGLGYQDVPFRKPSIQKAKNILYWEPKITMRETITRIINYPN